MVAVVVDAASENPVLPDQQEHAVLDWLDCSRWQDWSVTVCDLQLSSYGVCRLDN